MRIFILKLYGLLHNLFLLLEKPLLINKVTSYYDFQHGFNFNINFITYYRVSLLFFILKNIQLTVTFNL